MKKTISLLSICLLVLSSFTLTGCLKSGLDKLENSSDKELSAVEYTYRFLYTDTIKKGTVNQDIWKDRVCEVIFKKESVKIDTDEVKGFETTISYDANSLIKSGPQGSVTKAQLYKEFVKRITKDGITQLWVYVTIPDAANLQPLNGAPVLGKPGDFSKDYTYRVTAADGSMQDYVIKTIQGF